MSNGREGTGLIQEAANTPVQRKQNEGGGWWKYWQEIKFETVKEDLEARVDSVKK